MHKEHAIVLKHDLVIAQYACSEDRTVLGRIKVVKKFHSLQTLPDVLLFHSYNVCATGVLVIFAKLLFLVNVVIYNMLILVYEAGQLHDKVSEPPDKYISYVLVHVPVYIIYFLAVFAAIVLELKRNLSFLYFSTEEHLLDNVYVLQKLHEGYHFF